MNAYIYLCLEKKEEACMHKRKKELYIEKRNVGGQRENLNSKLTDLMSYL